MMLNKNITQNVTDGSTGLQAMYMTVCGVTNVDLAKQLGVLEDTLAGFFKILGNQDIPIENVREALIGLAYEHKELKRYVACLDTPGSEAEALKTKALEALKIGDYSEAERCIKEAKQNIKAVGDQQKALYLSSKRSEAYYQIVLAKSLAMRGEWDESKAAYNEALEIAGESESYDLVGECKYALGTIEQRFVRFDDAIQLFHEALTNFNRADMNKDIERQTAETYNGLGTCWNSKGDLGLSIHYLELALGIFKKSGMDTNHHRELAIVYCNLGAVWADKSKDFEDTTSEEGKKILEKAIQYSEYSLEMNEKIYGTQHYHVENIRNNLGSIWMDSGNLVKAEACFITAHKNLSSQKPTHEGLTVYAGIMSNYGALMLMRRQFYPAIKQINSALEIDLKLFGINHPKIAIRYKLLGSAFVGIEDFTNAKKYFQKSYDISLKVNGCTHKFTEIMSKELDWLNSR